MINDLRKLYNLYSNELFNYDKSSVFESIYRLLAIIIFPLLKKLNPNFISFLSILFGFAALIISIFQDGSILNILIIFFLISFILDFSDGMIARYQKKTSFHGRFIDGLFDIIVIGFLHIIFINYILSTENNLFDKNFYYTTLLLLPIQHLILDRFSALARWSNNINKRNKIQPYFRDTYLNYLTRLLLDLQHFCIFLVLFLNFYEGDFIIELYFILSFSASIITLFLYVFLSKKFLSKTSNQSDNKD